MALVLIEAQLIEEVKKWGWDMIDDMKKHFPDEQHASDTINASPLTYSHARGSRNADEYSLFILGRIWRAHKRMTMLEEWLRAKGKTFSDMTYTINGYDDQEYETLNNDIVRKVSALTTSNLVCEFLTRVGATPANNKILEYTEINKISFY